MGYKWKPSKAQRAEFARNMQDPEFASSYYQRQAAKAEKRRQSSRFNYDSAGGHYVPTEHQYFVAVKMLNNNITIEQEQAANMVISAFLCNDKTEHDNIHIVNEYFRSLI